LVDERLAECLESDGWSILLVELEHLDAFHEVYGFIASDDVLRRKLNDPECWRDLGGQMISLTDEPAEFRIRPGQNPGADGAHSGGWSNHWIISIHSKTGARKQPKAKIISKDEPAICQGWPFLWLANSSQNFIREFIKPPCSLALYPHIQ
jgi:hypothetical protein